MLALKTKGKRKPETKRRSRGTSTPYTVHRQIRSPLLSPCGGRSLELVTGNKDGREALETPFQVRVPLLGFALNWSRLAPTGAQRPKPPSHAWFIAEVRTELVSLNANGREAPETLEGLTSLRLWRGLSGGDGRAWRKSRPRGQLPP